MTTSLIIVLILAVEIFGTAIFSRFCLRNYPKVTSEAIGKLHPEFNNVGVNYLPLTLLIVPVSIIFYFLVCLAIGGSGISTILILGAPFISRTFFDAIFSLRTNIYPATTKTKWDDFVYDESKSLRWVAKYQIGIALVATVVNVIAWYIYRP